MKIDKPFEHYDFAGKPWYIKNTVGIEFGPTGSAVNDMDFMSKMTGKDIVEKALAANAEYLILFCKDGSCAYYKSKYRPMPESLQGRDLLQEVCDAAKGTGLNVLAYAVVQYDSYARARHPEWELKDCNGNGLYKLCLRSPGYIEEMVKIVDELTDYDIVGLHIDMLDIGFDPQYGCWCEHCQKVFREKYGYDMPKKFDLDDPKFKDVMEFRYTNNKDMTDALVNFVKKKCPEKSIDFNYHGAPPFSFEVGQRPVHNAACGDFITAESLPWIFGYNNPSLISHFMEAANPEIPFQVVTSRSIYNYHEYTLRPIEDMRFEIMNILSHGGTFTLVDKAGYDGWFDKNVYSRISGIFDEAKRKTKYTRGYKKLPSCAIFFSHKTRDYVWRSDARGYQNSIAGLAHMLVQEKINYEFIFDENVTLEMLQKYPLVILTNTGILSDDEAAMIREYVNGGGNIIATGAVGAYDDCGHLGGSSKLEDVLGVKFEGIANDSETKDNYFVFPERSEQTEKYGDRFDWVTEGFEDGYQLYCRDTLYRYAPVTAETFASTYIGFRPGKAENLENITSDIWNQLMSAGIRAGDGIFVNRFGNGKAVTLPSVPEKAYIGSHRTPELRKLICNIVRHLTPTPEIEVHAPLNTESVLMEDDIDNRILVHLTTYNPTLPILECGFITNDRRWYPPVMEEPAIYKCEVKVNLPFRRAYSVDGTPLKVDSATGTISFMTDKVYEIIVIEK